MICRNDTTGEGTISEERADTKQREVSEVLTGRPIMSMERGRGLKTKIINNKNFINLMLSLIQRV